ncbi:MAG: hypothetical protein A3K19_20165 [Lentisphaerae bacterium RIFOXYB12_FULL_65_16]|nr:MAG: hypothetical protein A3K18_11245 [Lentisphaerae bacterium RIFOXYA12_64_32]OGV91778.1 MAG: hypothetical protein A3K19_20165 [Lentisphaerae bacterium RIFOXYB12_FULL_65_16]
MDLLLRFLWRQWSALGVAGHADTGDRWPIDPEALLAFTCTIGRYDPRLFDEVLDWLVANERFVNVQRLRTVMRSEGFTGGTALAAVAGAMSKHGKGIKWRRLAMTEDEQPKDRYLFRRADNAVLPLVGEPDPVFKSYGWLRNPLELRGLSNEFPPHAKSTLWLRLRALFGVNARCEIVLLLLVSGRAGASDIARQTYYFHRTIQDAVGDMSRSGLVMSKRLGRERFYSLGAPEKWEALLDLEQGALSWVCWPPLLSALEAIWFCIQPDAFAKLPPLLQMSELRKLMRESAGAKFARSGLAASLPDEERLAGMEYLDELMVAVRNLLG